ncbi:hypothetical protein HJC23_012762, partial [Cyclotella cryptica]
PLVESSCDIDFLNRESCQSLCSERRLKLKADEEAVILARDEMMLAQKELIVNGLCKMKKDVRKMTVKDFNQTFGCDIIDMIKKQLEEGEEEGAAGNKRGVGAKTAVGVSLKTPAAVRFAGKPPTTRTVRKGERIISINGSPVDQFDKGELVVTAKKRKAVAAKTESTPFPISIGIGAGNGECIDLSDPSERMKLDGEQKALAKEQIMAMQEQMKNLMANW